MSEQNRPFEPISKLEVAEVAIGLPTALVAASEIYTAVTHFPDNVEVPAGQHSPYPQTTGLEEAGIGVGLPLLATIALVGITHGVRRFMHAHRQQPPSSEVPAPAQG